MIKYNSENNLKIKFMDITTILFFVSIIVFPRSFILLKLSCLIVFLTLHTSIAFYSGKLKFFLSIFIFYVFVGVAGIVWSIIGIINDSPINGIYDNFRLYFVWGVAWFIIISLLRNTESIKNFHKSLLISGVLIFAINALGIIDNYFKLDIFSESIKEELELRIGIHDTYVHVLSHNIASLFFIIPYFISLLFHRYISKKEIRRTLPCLILTLLLAVFTGRRALWVCVATAPLIIFILFSVTGNLKLMNKTAKIIMTIYFVFVFVAIGIAISEIDLGGTYDYFRSAFSTNDERGVQKEYLIEGFRNYFILGSGFGGQTQIIRNDDSPWLYELTYYQLFFNFGIVGIVYLLFFFLIYLFVIFKILRIYKKDSSIGLGIMVGFFSFLIASYSNPYLGSFDFLIYIAMLPYLSTFTSGFGDELLSLKLLGDGG